MCREDIRWVILTHGNFLDIGERRRYIENDRAKNDPYQCPMCREEEDTIYFMGACRKLVDLRKGHFQRILEGIIGLEKFQKVKVLMTLKGWLDLLE